MNIYNLTIKRLEDYFIGYGENKAKAKIVYNMLYQKRITAFSEIDILSERVVKILSSDFSFEGLKLLEQRESENTSKFLFELYDANAIETVLMRHDYGNGLCVSTQIGCNMGCVFCESGVQKKIRDLEPYEMVLQILLAERLLNEVISHVTLMGIGEPLDNYDNVMDFIDIIGAQHGLDIAARHITISTCGLIPQIEKLMMRKTHNNLAVSLHAPNDEIRNSLMPINKAYCIKKLIESVKTYSDIKNKKTTLEYIMLEGINDSEDCAYQLCNLLDGIKCYVNLIPYNQTSLKFKRPDYQKIALFYDILCQNGIKATIRREFGGDLKAACGQLRSVYIK